jgi:hypothetical protein
MDNFTPPPFVMRGLRWHHAVDLLYYWTNGPISCPIMNRKPKAPDTVEGHRKPVWSSFCDKSGHAKVADAANLAISSQQQDPT